MRAYSEVLADQDRRRKSLPACLFADFKFGEHKAIGVERWDTDIGDYVQFDIGLETRRFSFQLTRDEASQLAAYLNKFLQPTD